MNKDRKDQIIEIFEELTKTMGNKFHLFFEVNFQLGQFYLQVNEMDKAKSSLEKALLGFRKFKYEVPTRQIESLLKKKTN